MTKFSANGEQALAFGAIDEDITLATGYPGSPGGGIISLIEAGNNTIDTHWSVNEKIALEKAIGVAINGHKALVCVKGVGLNAMLDPLTVVNLTPLTGGLVIVVGDDPGGYGSQNDQDSRILGQFLNLPWFEPSTPQEGYDLMRMAFQLSKQYALPVFIRLTRSFASQKQEIVKTKPIINSKQFTLRNPVLPRFVPAPANAVAKSQELQDRMEVLKENIPLLQLNNLHTSASTIGLIACGHMYSKLLACVNLADLLAVAGIMQMQSIYPINENEITTFLKGKTKVIVFEENTPVITNQIKAIAADNKLILAWQAEHRPGEMYRWQIAKILSKEFPALTIHPPYDHPVDEKPQLKSNCSDCRYDEVLDLLDQCAAQVGQPFSYYGDPGCLVSVADRLQGKFAMGGSVATVFGANLTGSRSLNIALVGDSGFFHSSLPAIIDAAYHEMNIAIVMLNNHSARTTGSQYHPGITKYDRQQRLDYQSIMKSIGVNHFTRVNLNQQQEELIEIMTNFLKTDKPRFLQIDID